MNSLGNGIFEFQNFLSEAECAHWIQFCESHGFEDATIGIGRVQRVVDEVRNNERILIDDPELARSLWEKLEPLLPAVFRPSPAHPSSHPAQPHKEPIGLNERFRFYKYTPGQQFKPHQDRSFYRSATEWSELTFLVYLNGDIEGGETKFLKSIVKPETGKAVIFPHGLVHEGAPVTAGVKYVLRSDVMFRKDGQT